jgi:hypothetical protein
MAKTPGKGNMKLNETKTGQQPDYKGHVIADRDYKEGDYINFGVWKNNYDGFNIKISAPMPDKNQQQYPKPVVSDDGIPF